MKKTIVIILMLAICVGSVFALDFSVGLNGEWDYEWKNVSIEGKLDLPGIKKMLEAKNRPYTNLFGFNAFVDAQYVRLSVGTNWLVGGEKNKFNIKSDVEAAGVAAKDKITELFEGMQNGEMNMTCINVALVGKLPFKLGFARLYPFAGFDASFNIVENDGGTGKGFSEYMKRSFGRWSFIGGLGADIYLGDHFFIDATSVFGIELAKPNTTEKSLEKQIKNLGNEFKNFDVKDSHNYKVNFVIGAGYTF